MVERSERDHLVVHLEMARNHGIARLPDGTTLYCPQLKDGDEVLASRCASRLAELDRPQAA